MPPGEEGDEDGVGAHLRYRVAGLLHEEEMHDALGLEGIGQQS